MKRSRFSEEQIIGILKEHQAGLGAKELCRKHGISDATFYKWRSRYGGMEVSDARRLKALEAENAKLKGSQRPWPHWGRVPARPHGSSMERDRSGCPLEAQVDPDSLGQGDRLDALLLTLCHHRRSQPVLQATQHVLSR